MREDLPSLTAAFVAFARGAASARPLLDTPLDDEAARALLPAAAAWLLPRRASRGVGWKQGLLRVATAGLVDQLAQRTAAIDEALGAAVARGVTQLVLLGAGLDARAYRLPALARVRVFEVDHPATQRYKTQRLAGLASRAAEVTHVAVDFARDPLDAALGAAGHDPDAPTFWLWEGVTMYLPRAATAGTLGVIGPRSAAGSAIAVTYMVPEVVPLPVALRRLVEAGIELLGEPLVGAIPTREIAALLEQAGFSVQSDENSLGWSRRFGGSAVAPLLFRAERLAVATKA